MFRLDNIHFGIEFLKTNSNIISITARQDFKNFLYILNSNFKKIGFFFKKNVKNIYFSGYIDVPFDLKLTENVMESFYSVFNIYYGNTEGSVKTEIDNSGRLSCMVENKILDNLILGICVSKPFDRKIESGITLSMEI